MSSVVYGGPEHPTPDWLRQLAESCPAVMPCDRWRPYQIALRWAAEQATPLPCGHPSACVRGATTKYCGWCAERDGVTESKQSDAPFLVICRSCCWTVERMSDLTAPCDRCKSRSVAILIPGTEHKLAGRVGE